MKFFRILGVVACVILTWIGYEIRSLAEVLDGNISVSLAESVDLYGAEVTIKTDTHAPIQVQQMD